jgi:hypothetical protein
LGVHQIRTLIAAAIKAVRAAWMKGAARWDFRQPGHGAVNLGELFDLMM